MVLSIEERKRPITEYLNRQKSLQTQLANLISKTNTYYYSAFHTNPVNGLNNSTVSKNQAEYGKNHVARRRLKSLLQFFCNSLEDLMLRILIVAAIISIITEGLFSQEKSTFWIDGVTILAAVAVCSIVATLNDYQKQQQFQQLDAMVDHNNKFDVIRQGKLTQVTKDSIVVGDIINLVMGLEVPVDGLVIKSNDLMMDESSITGQNYQKYKDPIQKCQIHGVTDKKSPSPVVISGSKIMGGEGLMLCLLTGKDHCLGQLSLAIAEENDQCTPLQDKLEDLAEKIGIFGFISGIILFLILVLWLFISKIVPTGWKNEYVSQILGYMMLSITIIVVAVPEGLPLAVTISLAFSVKKMVQQNNLVKRLACCETMGSAHVICTDKTGTLTHNKMSVVEVWNGKNYSDSHSLKSEPFSQHKHQNIYKELVYALLVANSTAVLEPKPKGSATEIALIRYAQSLFENRNTNQQRAKFEKQIQNRLPFNSDRKRTTTCIRYNNENIMFLTGASEIILSSCQKMYDVKNKDNGISDIKRQSIQSQIADLAQRGLRVIALAYKKLEKEVTPAQLNNFDKFGVRQIEKSGFTLLLIIGIEDLPRPQSKEAIRQCNRAGVVVIMVTGDNSITARSIGDRLGITKSGDQTVGLCMQGDQFEKLELNATPQQFYQRVKHLKILSRSRPQHKLRLVQGLKKINNVVALTGDGTNDVPALMKANVGVAMGISGTQIAKNAADILIMDDNFNSIVRSIVWGRNIYCSIKKFLQFQLTANVVACLLLIIASAIFRQSIFTTVQMLWINMIMDSLASLALATQAPNTEQMLRKKPVNRSESLITKTMMKHIIIQSLFQMAILFFLTVKGQAFLPESADDFDQVIGSDLEAKYYNGQLEGTMVNGLYHPVGDDYSYEPYFKKYHVYSRHFTFLYNVFVFFQIFNFFNCRKINDQINLLSGLFDNYIFWVIFCLISLFQWVIVYFLNRYFDLYNYHGLTGQQWIISLLIGVSVIPLSLIIRLLPFWKPQQEGIVTDEANDLLFRQKEQECEDSNCQDNKIEFVGH